jgi:hypothetical protein
LKFSFYIFVSARGTGRSFEIRSRHKHGSLAAIPKRTMEKIEMRPSKLKLVPLSVILALLTILPVYFVYIIDYLPDNPTLKITCLPVSIFLGYNTYRLIKRLFIGPIITLTADSIILRDNDKVNTYRWTDVQSIKVEPVSESSFGKIYERTIATIWTKTKNSSDSYYVSDLKENADDLRTLINKFRESTAAKH